VNVYRAQAPARTRRLRQCIDDLVTDRFPLAGLSRSLSGRNLRYLGRRARSVVGRYGVTPRKAQERAQRCVRALAQSGLSPTFATPGRVVGEHPEFFRELSDAGVELAVHGYDHVDFRGLSPADAAEQFTRAVDAYSRAGVPCEGFRCPYLSCTPDIADVLPPGVFSYSSNEAIAWDVVPVDERNPVFAQLASFYRARGSSEVLSTPSIRDGLVEIPASIPDDLQLWDALRRRGEGVAQGWADILREAHRRGELFAPLFHPESFDLIQGPVQNLLRTAEALRPAVWLTQLRAVAGWWRERQRFSARVLPDAQGVTLEFDCSDRATILVRDWDSGPSTRAWDGRWSILDARSVRIAGPTRPLLGVLGVDRATVEFLGEQGYIIDSSDGAPRCSVVVDGGVVRELGDEVRLIEHIEASPGPLVKFSRWPEGAKAAFCLAGDLDALSLRDYARRLVG
jgi:peptidoglycan/xylan/chitin deacetylase (PgdA/CDA1 family)